MLRLGKHRHVLVELQVVDDVFSHLVVDVDLQKSSK